MDTPRKSAETSSIILLEEKISFQQHQLEELNSVVLRQEADIAELQRELGQMRLLLRNLLDRVGEDLPHEKPPHY